MKKIISLIAFSFMAIIAYSQDSMNKKMENPTDKMNKKMENKSDKMNKKLDNSGDSLHRVKPDSAKHKSKHI